jgi:2-methylisocitrate lyase-like PEP mutase family enzyme
MSNQNFRDLHRGPAILLLPNAWDAGSARLIESIGAKAIATTSAGVAWSRGYPDGDAIPIEQLLATVREITRVIRVPLSVDIEGGYSDDPTVVKRVVDGIIEAGAVGINIEDRGGSPDLLCTKIEAARQSATRAGADLFINARTDIYLRSIASGDAAVEEVVRRAGRYRDAGCDGIFVPSVTDSASIKAIVTAIDPLPLNVLALTGLPSVDVLQEQGVRRLSAGSGIARAALTRASTLAAAFLDGSVAQMFSEATSHLAMNQLFTDS